MLYGEVFKALNKAKVKYVIAGGLAVILYGFERLTKDLDLIVFLKEKNLSKFYNELVTVGYAPRVPATREEFIDPKRRREWQKEKGMIVFSFVDKKPPFKVVDVFVKEPFPFKEIYKKRFEIEIEKIKLPLISIEHLKILKRQAGRPQDLIDFVQLDKIARERNNEG